MNARRFPRKTFGAGAAAVVFGSGRARAADTYTLRFGLTTGPQGEMFSISTEFARDVARASNGRLNIEIYPGSTLAGQNEIISALQSGVVDLTVQSSTRLASLFPSLEVLDLPFMFKNTTAAYRVLDGPIGHELSAGFEGKGIVLLAWGDDGFRQIATIGKAVRVPEDLKGMRLRIQESPITVAMLGQLGAIPVTIAVSETYTALLQKVVDGVESPLTTLSSEKFGELTKFVAITNHGFACVPFLGSKKKIDALPADLQAILKNQAGKTHPYWQRILGERISDARKALASKGTAFTDIDYPAFRKAMEPVYAQLQTKIGGDLIARVSKAASS